MKYNCVNCKHRGEDYMRSKFGTGIWNSIKDPYIYGGAAIGAGIGIYEASTIKGIQGNEIELGALGAITGVVIGKGLRHLNDRPDGLRFWRQHD